MLRAGLILLLVLSFFIITGCFIEQTDTDGDGIFDKADNCLEIPNPGQEDADNDWVGDVCDNCPTVANPDQDPAVCQVSLDAPQNVQVSNPASQGDPNIDEKGPDGHWDQAEIRITWDGVPDALYYRVYRCDDEDCSSGIYSQVSGDITELAWSDAVSVSFDQDCCDAPPCSCSDIYSTSMTDTAWYNLSVDGVDWGKESGDQPAGSAGGDMLLKAPRTYSYKVKAFGSSGAESAYSDAASGSRLPYIDEMMYDIYRPEEAVFLNRAYCCNNEPYLDDSMNFEGDVSGSATYYVEGGHFATYTKNFLNYENKLLVFNGSLQGYFSTDGNGWETGTVFFNGTYNGEVDYTIRHQSKWGIYGTYTMRYEGESKLYYHSKNQSIEKPAEGDCDDMGIPFNPMFVTWDCM